MVESFQNFPHVRLRFFREGNIPPPLPHQRPRRSAQSIANSSDRYGHGSKLQTSLQNLTTTWVETQSKREEEGKPLIKDAISLLLRIDPNSFEAYQLKELGIEVISELDDGYIIGTSADANLSTLQKKIDQFIRSEKGGGRIAELWEIIEDQWQPKCILSEDLLNEWDQIQDQEIYVVDIGVACIGTKAQLAAFPKRSPEEDDDNYIARVNRWLEKRDLSYSQWDALQMEREKLLEEKFL